MKALSASQSDHPHSDHADLVPVRSVRKELGHVSRASCCLSCPPYVIDATGGRPWLQEGPFVGLHLVQAARARRAGQAEVCAKLSDCGRQEWGTEGAGQLVPLRPMPSGLSRRQACPGPEGQCGGHSVHRQSSAWRRWLTLVRRVYSIKAILLVLPARVVSCMQSSLRCCMTSPAPQSLSRPCARCP